MMSLPTVTAGDCLLGVGAAGPGTGDAGGTWVVPGTRRPCSEGGGGTVLG